MKTRVITGVFIAAVLAALCLFADMTVRLCVFAALAIVAQKEMTDALRKGDHAPLAWPGYIFAFLMAPAVWFGGIALVWALALALTAAVFSARVFSKRLTTANMLWSLLTLVYPLPFFAAVLTAVTLPEPIASTLLVMGVIYAAATDVFAYFVGSFLGKHKLCPQLSPKKTVEGAVGGFAGCALVGVALFFIQPLWHSGYPWWLYIACAPFCSIAGQIGDLAASIIKRELGVKDYGFIFPGHGGVMDRLDSMLFALPMAYLFFMVICRTSGLI